MLQRKEQPQKKAAEWVVDQELSSMKPSIKEFTKIDGNTTSCSINGIKASARIRVEQDADLVLKNLKFKILDQPNDDVLLATNRRLKHYKANKDRIILKDGLLFRKYYGETGSVKYYQILIPKQLVNEVLRNFHGEFCKHPGITKTIIAYREKYYYPNMAQLIKEWVLSCEQCLRESRINPQLTRPPLQNPNESLLRQKPPCKLIWCRDYRHPVAMKALCQPFMCFPAIYLHTRHQIRTPKQSLK